jgi:hypothetical protein
MSEEHIADGMSEVFDRNQNFMRGFVETCADKGFSKLQTVDLWDASKDSPTASQTRYELVDRD